VYSPQFETRTQSKGCSHGFTLVELLVVIAILSVLLTILVPALQKAREQARLAICMSNQRQIVLAVLNYAGDNDGRFPPTINYYKTIEVNRPTSPCRITYHTNKLGGPGANGGWLGQFMLPYLEHWKYYYCPLAGAMSPDYAKMLECAYMTGEVDSGSASYNMLWNYDGYYNAEKNQHLPLKRGPRGMADANSSRLLTCDVLYYQEPAGYMGWISCHPLQRGLSAKADPDLSYYSLMNYWCTQDPDKEVIPELPFNAGFADGHCEKYYFSETVMVGFDEGPWEMYILDPLR